MLVWHSGCTDPALGGEFSIKRYQSTGAVLEPGSEVPLCWWVPFETIAEIDLNLATSRYKPRVDESTPDEHPALPPEKSKTASAISPRADSPVAPAPEEPMSAYSPSDHEGPRDTAQGDRSVSRKKVGQPSAAPEKAPRTFLPATVGAEPYRGLVGGIAELLEAARRTSARTVNAIMTATYWEIGRRIVDFEQQGRARAEYGEMLLERLARDLTARFGRGFSHPNVSRFRRFYLALPRDQILSTPLRESRRPILSTLSTESGQQRGQTPPEASSITDLAPLFPLP